MLCEIDREVIDTALKYYPEIPGDTFDDERTVVVIADGRKFVAETDERFDAIIVDSVRADRPLRRAAHAGVLRLLQARAEGGRHPRHAERPAVPVSRSPARHDARLRLAVRPRGAVLLHAALLLRRPVRAQLGVRRGRAPRHRREEAGQAPGEARHRDEVLDAGRAQRRVRAAALWRDRRRAGDHRRAQRSRCAKNGRGKASRRRRRAAEAAAQVGSASVVPSRPS